VADACLTLHKKLACTIMVADCLPVLFTDVDGWFVAAAHAGWRGLAGGVLKNIIKTAVDSVNYDLNASKIIAWLGPCIGPDAFEVGAEVKAEFVEKIPNSESFFRPINRKASCSAIDKYLVDLAGLTRLNLQQLGIDANNIYGNDSSAPWCTVSNPSRYFSHRRDAARLGSTGRMAGCIWID
jgi:YfiH family protein